MAGQRAIVWRETARRSSRVADPQRLGLARIIVRMAAFFCAFQPCGTLEPAGTPAQNAVQPTITGQTGLPAQVDQPTVGVSSDRPTRGPEHTDPEGRRSGLKETGPNFRATVITGQSNGEVPPT